MAAMNDAQYEALVEASRAEQSQEQAEFVAQIREYFPDGKQNMAVAMSPNHTLPVPMVMP